MRRENRRLVTKSTNIDHRLCDWPDSSLLYITPARNYDGDTETNSPNFTGIEVGYVPVRHAEQKPASGEPIAAISPSRVKYATESAPR